MPKSVDHSERRRRIVAESLKLFATAGYSQVNFGMIAQASGVSRTILYTYFQDKRAIFNEAIDEVTRKVRSTYESVAKTGATADAKLRQVCLTVFALMFENRSFVCVIADVLTNYRREGSAVPVERVTEHTAGLLRIFSELVAEGVAKGEYRRDLEPPKVADLLYAQYEAAALRIAVTGNADFAACFDGLDAVLRLLRA